VDKLEGCWLLIDLKKSISIRTGDLLFYGFTPAFWSVIVDARAAATVTGQRVWKSDLFSFFKFFDRF